MIQLRYFDSVIQIMMSPERNGSPGYWVSAYLVDGLLIDTGCVRTAPEMAEFLAGRTPFLAVNTHYHEDHVGGNKLLQEALGLKIMAHRESIPFIEDPPDLSHYRKKNWGAAPSSNVSLLPSIVRTGCFSFHVVETPGHCAGHVALVEPSRGWCFSGDLYVGRKLRVASTETDISLMVRSMEKILAFDVKNLTLFTGLRTVEPAGRKALAGSVTQWKEMSYRAKSLRKAGMTVDDIVQEFWRGESVFNRITKGALSSARLVCKLLEAEI